MLDTLPSCPLDDPATTLHELALTLQRSLGGTSGPLYAMLLLRAAAYLRTNNPELATTWAQALRSGAAGIEELGGAAVGDRTMLDALVPASEALTSSLELRPETHRRWRPRMRQSRWPIAAAQATASMTPRQGRSSYLGDRALGHPDPGAVAVAIWLRAVAKSFEPTSHPY